MAAPGCAVEHARGDHGGEHVAANEIPFFVDEEDPIGVAVECGAEVVPVLDHGAPQHFRVFRFNGIRGMVRERTIRLEIERHDLDGQVD